MHKEPLHTRDWELILMEYVNANGCKVYHGFLHGIEWIMFYAHLDYFHKLPLGGRPSTKPGDHGNVNVHNHECTLFECVWVPAWIEIHWNSIWLRAQSHIYGFTVDLRVRDHTTWFWRWLGTAAFGHSLSFGLSQFHGHGCWLVCEGGLTKKVHDNQHAMWWP